MMISIKEAARKYSVSTGMLIEAMDSVMDAEIGPIGAPTDTGEIEVYNDDNLRLLIKSITGVLPKRSLDSGTL